MPGQCRVCGSDTYLGRTIFKNDIIEIQNIACTVCQECGDEEIGRQTQIKIDKLLERAAKGKIKSRFIVI
jgi:YgiT-type zinc finger domain-containing protein